MFPDPQVPSQLWQERLGQYAELRLAAQVRHASTGPSRTKVARRRISAQLGRVAPILSGAKS
jgi:hypothetical protein